MSMFGATSAFADRGLVLMSRRLLASSLPSTTTNVHSPFTVASSETKMSTTQQHTTPPQALEARVVDPNIQAVVEAALKAVMPGLLQPLRNDLAQLNLDVRRLREDVQGLREDIEELRTATEALVPTRKYQRSRIHKHSDL
ncbi:hypothetical protein HGRIS_011127 [Hohenbuehelia grisea]|uniref:Uncharacterized protein n=1 Tax=Hohenbuehelia grisea TaxID=104357 RepID=A0ABR3IZB9_9AGAR